MKTRIQFTKMDDLIITISNEEERGWMGRERGASFDDISIEIDLADFCNLSAEELQALQEWAENSAENHMRAALHRRAEEQAEDEREMLEQDQQRAIERKANKGKKPGYVYLVLAENGLYKIGRAKDVTTRLQPFSVHFPMKWELVHSFQSDNYSAAEANLHQAFQDKREIGEWFRLAPEDVEYITALQDGAL